MKIEQNWKSKLYKPKIHNDECMIYTNKTRYFESPDPFNASIWLVLNSIEKVERERDGIGSLTTFAYGESLTKFNVSFYIWMWNYSSPYKEVVRDPTLIIT